MENLHLDLELWKNAQLKYKVKGNLRLVAACIPESNGQFWR